MFGPYIEAYFLKYYLVPCNMVSSREVFICFYVLIMVEGYYLSTISEKFESHLENPEEAIEQSYKSFRYRVFKGSSVGV